MSRIRAMVFALGLVTLESSTALSADELAQLKSVALSSTVSTDIGYVATIPRLESTVDDDGVSKKARADQTATAQSSSKDAGPAAKILQTADLKIPKYIGGEKTIELQGSVKEIVLGGGGRYVVLHTEPEGEVLVFDVSQGVIIHRFRVDAGTMIAASAEFLITVTSFDKSVEFRPFENLARPRRTELPIDCAVLDIAVGHASNGPLCLCWAEGTGEMDRTYLSYLQLSTLEPVIPRGVFQSNHVGNPIRVPIGRWGEYQGMGISSFRDKPRLRASASGDVFGCWSIGHTPSGLGVSTFDAGSILTFYDHTSVGHVAPSADGQFVCTANGIYSVDLARKKGAAFTVPTAHPNFLLSFPTTLSQASWMFDLNKGKVINSQNGHVALELPSLLDVVGPPSGGESPNMIKLPMDFQSGITLDQRLMLIPQAKALVTLRADNRSLRIRPIELRETSLPIDSETPAQYRLRNGVSTAEQLSTLNTEILADRTSQIRVPGVIGDALEAASGKYLLIHLAEKGEVIVIDAYQGTAVKVLRVPADALIAASANELVVLSPFSKKLSRWELGSFKQVSEVTLKIGGQVDAIAMGSSSNGPLLLHWRDLRVHKCGFAFYDPRTLLPLANRTLTEVSEQASFIVGESGRNGEFELRHYHAGSAAPVLRASVNGKVFGLSDGNCVIAFTLSEKSVTAKLSFKSVLYAAPSPDGLDLCTDSGYYTADMTRVRTQDPSVPSTDSLLYLSFQNPDGNTYQSRSFPVKGFVNSQETGRSMFALPELTEMKGQFEIPQQLKNIALDRRYHLLVDSSSLVTVPPTNDRIILRKLQIPEDKVGNNQPLVPDASLAADMRTWTDNTGKHRFKAALIASKDDQVELRAIDGRKVSVPISRLSKSDQEYLTAHNGRSIVGTQTSSVYSYVKIKGRAGDYLSGGKDFYVDGVKSGMQLTQTKRGVLVITDGWTLHFEAEEGGFLKVGKFSNAVRTPSIKELPGIYISGQGRACNEVSGEFKVLEIEFMGEKIHRLAIDFSQNCEKRQPPLTGMLRFNSTVR